MQKNVDNNGQVVIVDIGNRDNDREFFVKVGRGLMR